MTDDASAVTGRANEGVSEGFIRVYLVGVAQLECMRIRAQGLKVESGLTLGIHSSKFPPVRCATFSNIWQRYIPYIP